MMKDRFINKRELAKNIANLIELLKRSLIIAEQEIEKPKEISEQEFQKNKGIYTLKAEFEQNKKTYENNINLLDIKLKMEEANLEDFQFEERKYHLNKELLDIELKNFGIANAVMNYNKMDSWIEKMREFKKFEAEIAERNFKIAQKNFENQKTKIENNIDKEKIKEQQKRIEKRNDEIKKELEEKGIKIEDFEKQDYIG